MLSKTIAENASAASSEIFGRVRLKELPTFSNAITLDAHNALSETFVRIPKFENSIKNNVKSALLALIHIFFSFCCNRRRFFFLFIIFLGVYLKILTTIWNRQQGSYGSQRRSLQLVLFFEFLLHGICLYLRLQRRT